MATLIAPARLAPPSPHIATSATPACHVSALCRAAVDARGVLMRPAADVLAGHIDAFTRGRGNHG
jgi:hypothetical protein